MNDIEYLKKSYSERKVIIKKRLNDFKEVFNLDDKRIFAELCYCLLTPQSKAKSCDLAINNLVENNLLYNGNEKEIKEHLNEVRFHNNKSKYIVEARKLFTESNKLKIKEKISKFMKNEDKREWLTTNVKGLGLKESAHFLRNIGIYKNLTILDRHILRNLNKYGVVKEIPKTLNKRTYLDIEKKFLDFSKEVKIPAEELDLLFWSEQTGEVFK